MEREQLQKATGKALGSYGMRRKAAVDYPKQLKRPGPKRPYRGRGCPEGLAQTIRWPALSRREGADVDAV
jgi:hypothetical protein